MFTTISNFLKAVPVTLYGAQKSNDSKVRIPLLVASVQLDFKFREIIVHSNPQDWIQRTPKGGSVTLSGIVYKHSAASAATNVAQLLQGHYLYKIELGTLKTLYGCRKTAGELDTTNLGGAGARPVTVIQGTLTYEFDDYST